MSENEAMAGSTSRHEQAEVLRQHYESISLRASDWCNQIPIAIDLWERWPDLERQLDEAQKKLARIESEACVCNQIRYPLSQGCIVHDEQSVIARILKEE